VLFALATLLTFVWRRNQRAGKPLPAPKVVQEAKS